MVRAVTIDNFWVNLFFQLHIYNPLFENVALDNVFEISGFFQSYFHQTTRLKVLNGQSSKIDQIL